MSPERVKNATWVSPNVLAESPSLTEPWNAGRKPPSQAPAARYHQAVLLLTLPDQGCGIGCVASCHGRRACAAGFTVIPAQLQHTMAPQSTSTSAHPDQLSFSTLKHRNLLQ